MDTPAPGPPAPDRVSVLRRLSAPRPLPAGRRPPGMRQLPTVPVLAGVAGCLFLLVAASPRFDEGVPPFLETPNYTATGVQDVQDWLFLAVPAAATVVGLCLLRWWPYLLAAAALTAVPAIVSEVRLARYPFALALLPPAGYYLALIALLACAQSLARTALVRTTPTGTGSVGTGSGGTGSGGTGSGGSTPMGTGSGGTGSGGTGSGGTASVGSTPVRTAVGWGAAVAALALGSRLLGSAMASAPGWGTSPYTAAVWHIVLLVLGLAGIAPAVWRYRRGDPAAVPGPAGPWSWQRVRMVAAGTLAAALALPLSLLTTQRLADLLGVTWSALYRHEYAQTAVIGTITLVTVALLAAVAGLWSLAAALTAALVQVAVVAPAMLAITALDFNAPVLVPAALGGALLGAAVAGSRWRFPLAATLTVLAATALLIAYAATTEDPAKLAYQHTVIPAVLMLVLCTAAATAVVGATAPVLAPRGALPAVLGPLAAALTAGGLQTIEATDGLSYQVYHLTSSAVLLLVGGAAVTGLGFAQVLATRRAERKQAEQIRIEAAAAERDRLARPIHDGVLQVLALMQRHGSELGDRGSQLAALAGEQEVALRGLLSGAAGAGRDAAEDLRGPLQALATPAVEVAIPAQPVALPAATAAEVVAAVRAALDNVRRHAGDGARAWVLLEDERDGVRVTVRDDGVGFAPERPAEAAEAGRLGIAQSMRGRIADRGGTTAIRSRPGEGTEVEFWVPRVPPARG